MYVCARVWLCVCRHSSITDVPIHVHTPAYTWKPPCACIWHAALLPSIVRIGCDPRLLFLRLGLNCMQTCVMSQKYSFSTCSNASTNSTFAVTPLVLTPLLHNQNYDTITDTIKHHTCPDEVLSSAEERAKYDATLSERRGGFRVQGLGFRD